MKSLLSRCYSKAILSVTLPGLYLCTLAVVQAGARDPLFPGPARPEVDNRTELSPGYLIVYSATDQFNDGDVLYYAHSSYSIYTIDGKFFKNVENHISRSDEIPALVTLPAGSYTILLRSENRGYIRLPIVISAGRRTILDPDEAQTDLQKRFAQPRDPRRMAKAGTTRVQVPSGNFSILRKPG